MKQSASAAVHREITVHPFLLQKKSTQHKKLNSAVPHGIKTRWLQQPTESRAAQKGLPGLEAGSKGGTPKYSPSRWKARLKKKKSLKIVLGEDWGSAGRAGIATRAGQPHRRHFAPAPSNRP